jgi:hypothetical protein
LAIFTAIRRASSLLMQLGRRASAWLILEIDIGELLAAVIADNKARFQFLDSTRAAGSWKRTLNAVSLLMLTRHLNGLLIVAILLISTAPLYAQGEQQNIAKLKADARNLVGIIGSDKTKTQTYCQIYDLSEQLLQAVQEKDIKKANALAEKIAKLNKKMGPEFAALIDIEKHVDLDSRDGQEIASIVASLGESCGEK